MNESPMNVSISSPACLIGFALLGSIGVRALLSLLKAMERSALRGLWPDFWSSFAGYARVWVATSEEDRSNESADYSLSDEADCWYPFLLGWIELGVYPIAISINEWGVIGGWLALKTVAQWNLWQHNRRTFNRFLIGNAVVVLLSIALYWNCVQ